MSSTRIRDLVDISELMDSEGYVFENGGFIDPHGHGCGSENVSLAALSMLSGKTTVEDVLGVEEHGKQYLTESYLAGVSLDRLAADSVKMRIGRPFDFPDYPILPVVYALNMAAANAKNYEEMRSKHAVPLTWQSCSGHVHIIDQALFDDQSHGVVKPSGLYKVHFKVHRPSLQLKVTSEDQIPLLVDFLNSIGDTQFQIEGMSREDYAMYNIAPTFDASFSHVASDDVLVYAQKITEGIRRDWKRIVEATNTVTQKAGRRDLHIDGRIVDAIALYALEGRYNALSPFNRKH